MRRLFAGLLVLAGLVLPASASASITSVFAGKTVSGQAIPCVAQSDGVRVCHGDSGGPSGPDLRLRSFDGAPLEVYVILPASGNGPFPLLAQNHGWGGKAGGPNDTGYLGPTADAWAKEGVGTLQLTARGFQQSCGKPSPPLFLTAQAACGTPNNGFIRLDDDRYEVRDIQNALGLLVDAHVADPGRLGTTGPSYGGGVSLQLATLKDRMMLPGGSLTPWKSPAGTPLSIAASAPVIPWSDLVYSLVPNGHTLDYTIAGPSTDLSPVGVPKQSFVSGLFALGSLTGSYSLPCPQAAASPNATCPPGSDPQADLSTWFGAINQGDPPSAEDSYITDQIARYHSAYYLLDGAYGAAPETPSPLFIANGFTDDLFPVDEALRYYNYAHAHFPASRISLFDWDGGHQRGQNKAADEQLLSDRIKAFFEYYLKGSGSQPVPSFTALTQTCPASAPSGGPFTASSWAGLHPGEVELNAGGARSISSNGGDPNAAKAFDPIAGPGACATAAATDASGTASYRLPAVTGSGYTLLGSPTVIANLSVTGPYPQIAARLLDVNPQDNSETLVARGLYRLDPSKPNGLQVFQLHPGAWHFAAGHVVKLELLGQDSPYGRANNEPFTITVTSLQLRIPVHETPGSPGVPGVVVKPKPPFIPGHSGKPKRCVAVPSSRIAKRRTRLSRRGLFVTGTAGERPCAGASRSVRRRQHVARVLISVARQLRHGRCRFLTRSGRLTRPRPCSRPVTFTARGRGRWTLRLRMRVPAGTYLIRSDAVDGLRHHQRHSVASAQGYRVR